MEVRVMTRSVIRTAAILAAALVTLSACATANAPSATPTSSGSASAAALIQPTHPVEFVISTAPGGGSDIYARAMATIIENKKFSPQPVTPLNKEGGSGAVAFQYVYEKTGDMHYVMITLNSFFTTIITQKLSFKATDFTPVANLALDPFFLWVIDDYFIMRAIMAPPGLSQGQQAFWIDVFKKVYDSDEWKKFMSDNALQPDFKSGIEFRQFILQYQQLHQDIATKFKWV